jgi:glycosyltransferase involved in cell wall biosynthesis
VPLVPGWVREVIVVDGHSADDTRDVARAIRSDVRVLEQQGRGKGAAMRTGFAAARGDVIVMLDADGSMDPREIDAFVRTLADGADFAKGSRFLPGGGTTDMPWYRKAGNFGFVLMVRALFGGHYTDLCYGYNAFSRSAILGLDLDCNGFEIETMMNIRALKAGLRVVEVPSFERERIHGMSNLHTIRDGWRVLRTILREWRRPPPRVVPRPVQPPARVSSAVVVRSNQRAVAIPVRPLAEFLAEPQSAGGGPGTRPQSDGGRRAAGEATSPASPLVLSQGR